MSSQKRLTTWILPAALALAAAGAAAQSSKPAQGAIKSVLNKAGEMKTAGAEHEAKVEQAQKATGVPTKAADPKAPQAKPGQAKSPQAKEGTASGTVEAAKKAASQKGAAAKSAAGGRRDPFVNPIRQVSADAAPLPANLPPGIAGLLIGQANLVGVLKTTQGMKAMVVATGGRTFFLKENDKVYNGRVVKITADSLVFEESVLDPLGQTVKREVVKKLPADK